MAIQSWRDVTRRQLNAAGFLCCAALMAAAFYFQYVLKLTPCNMCYLQRVGVVELGVVFLLAALHDPGRIGARVYALLILVAASIAVALSARHVWMQMQPAGSLPSCGADFWTMVDMIPLRQVVTRIINGGGECQAIQWTLFGLSMPAYLIMTGTLLGAGGVLGNLTLRRARD
jgi:protein dithiol:quinone oxidoreductase